jgi:hypothetical protein
MSGSPAADWACKQCGFDNFRRRETCKECGHHKHSQSLARVAQDMQHPQHPSLPQHTHLSQHQQPHPQLHQHYQPEQMHQRQQAQQPPKQHEQQHLLQQPQQQQGRSYGDILAGAFASHASVYPLNPLIASANFSMGSTEVRPGDW